MAVFHPSRSLRLPVHARCPALVASLLLLFILTGCPDRGDRSIRIFKARAIYTMEADPERADAVAVRAGRILAVGSEEEVGAIVGDRPHVVDERFADKILFPGFVDPHLHPTLAATILPMEIVSAMEWLTPRGRTRAVQGRDAFLARLRELDRERADPDAWLMVWGYHAPYHGTLSKSDLDAVSERRPIMVWQRSVHEMYFNSRALSDLGMNEAEFDAHPHADWETGHLWETGTLSLGRPMMRKIASPASYLNGLRMMIEVIHRGGLTTVGEQGFPQVNAWAELLSLRFSLWRHEAPFRFVLVPNAMFLAANEDTLADAVSAAEALLDRGSDRVRVVKHAKYYSDGAIFSQLMQMSEPYLDGHHGAWMMEPERQREVLDAFARAGFDVHIHVNGDAGLDLVLDQVEAQQQSHLEAGLEAPRVVLEHYGYARPDQHARLRELSVEVSNNAYYTYELAPIYADHGLGPQRAADISPLGDAARAGVPISFHSDFPMAPAEPLRLAWVAVNRIASDGRVWGAHQKLPLELALRAITIEGARSLGMQNEIGSIRPGKLADFTVLEADPYAVEPTKLAEIPIWGTVLEGVPHPLRD
jgi:predicted amidohydrolase YtcJ